MAVQFILAVQLAVAAPVRLGSKQFTESVILADMAVDLCRAAGLDAVHKEQLGGTRQLWEALLHGDIDAYPEYTGTLLQEILTRQNLSTDDDLRRALSAVGVGMTAPLGFNDTYAIGMRESDAARLGIRTISDLRQHPELHLAMSNEFMDRHDGWPTLRDRYRLPQQEVRGMEHSLAYRALQDGSIAATDLYSTDAEIRYYQLRVLEDDQHIFPAYRAVFVYRLDLASRAPDALRAMRQLEGRINEAAMIGMNEQAKLQKIPEARAAGDFLKANLSATGQVQVATLSQQLWQRTSEHLFLVGVSLAAALMLGLPLGIIAAKSPRVGQIILAAVAAIYTIPSLALLVFMIPFLGIGAWPAIVALFLYSLLPIVRNTETGLRSIPAELRESAEALGLPAWTRLTQIELPLAARPILAGIKTAAVINVGTATLGALIGAGGYGQPILTGIRLADTRLILLGAVPAALLALAAQAFFDLLDRIVTPRGLAAKRQA